MKSDACERYLEDPEAHAAHLDDCEECRSLFGPSDLPARSVSFDVNAMPLAAWEGAAHRPWSLIALAVLAIAVTGAALFLLAGVPPASGVRVAATTAFPPATLLRVLPGLLGEAAQHAPGLWQVGVLIAFVIVNTILFVLLRRAPKGLDV